MEAKSRHSRRNKKGVPQRKKSSTVKKNENYRPTSIQENPKKTTSMNLRSSGKIERVPLKSITNEKEVKITQKEEQVPAKLTAKNIIPRMIPRLKSVKNLELFHDSACSDEYMVDECDNSGFYGPPTRKSILLKSLKNPVEARKDIMKGALSSVGALRVDKNQSLELTMQYMKESKEEQYRQLKELFPTITHWPPPLRSIWPDLQGCNHFGLVIGYYPSLLFNFNCVQETLISFILETKKELIKSGEVEEDSLTAYYGEDPKILLRVTVFNILEACHVKNEELIVTKHVEGTPIDHDTFDSQEAHGRDARIKINEPVLTKRMMDCLSTEEFENLRKLLGKEKDERKKLLQSLIPLFSKRIEAIFDQIELIVDGIESRYLNNTLGRRSLPKRIDNIRLKEAMVDWPKCSK